MLHAHQQFRSRVGKCAEKGHGEPNRKCSVRVPKQSIIYCGEDLRDEMMGQNLSTHEKICDCIVYMKSDAKISLVEMKSKVCGDFVGQFEGGLKILKHMLTADTFSLQAVLATRSSPSNRSEFSMLRKPLTGVNPRIGIKHIKCNGKLPKCYISGCRLA